MSSWSYDGLRRRRRPTRTVYVGDVAVGSEHPLRVQSMTTPSTRDTQATVGQIERLVDAGCEIVRLTVPTGRDADNLPAIRAEMNKRKLHVPLVADIHFTPAAAMKAVEHVEKVRINPGNYADKKKFAVREYTDDEYREELERIGEVFSPLVLRAKELGVSMRIGTNHGSLSDRIMNRYGDTPLGMVESALEFVRICEVHDYRELILSMKASNPVVVLQVYRLLAQRMAECGMDYPFHLGVTEAGDGEDGRVKSAVGIGALLDEGIGDTVRVSLTEDPVAEIPVARALVAPYHGESATAPEATPTVSDGIEERRDPFVYERRASARVEFGPHEIGAGLPVRVEVPLVTPLADAKSLRGEIDSQVGARVPEETRAEILSIHVGSPDELEALRGLRESVELVAPSVALSARVPAEWLNDPERRHAWVYAAHRLHVQLDADAPREATASAVTEAAQTCRAILVEATSAAGSVDDALRAAVDLARACTHSGGLMLGVSPALGATPMHTTRRLVALLSREGLDTPVVLIDRPAERGADPMLGSARSIGALLCDGIGDAVHIDAGAADESRRLAYGILQAARVRITRTEFISCPSCGRTLFDLEETTARIKSRTSHLKGVKIAVMGCIVNGPGEMADADFGYVGWGEDKIALFVGKEMVAKDIPTHEADERLVELIKQHGRWVEPSNEVGV
ncbi:MAG: (E)-4-hydroxy-3-methylbut-2-enyl-diphosphate synthase [bacterium]|nr:(E)-4-hydroxy-3-methylbut-2-enyl-diphosphate synthase [bacterium]